MATVRLVSAGTGRAIDAPDTLTVAELRDLAGISDDVQLAFNGDVVSDENDQVLEDGDTIVGVPRKVSHGS